MDSEDVQNLKELIQSLENSQRTSEFVKWMEEISAPDYGLIDSMVDLFLDKFDDLQFINSVLRALEILNNGVKSLVLPQMRANKNFPKAIVKYLTNTKQNDLEGAAFILLVEIFDKDTFGENTNEQFVKTLFNSFGFINDERVFLAIVNILIIISSTCSLEKNVVLDQCAENENSRFFAECFLVLLNKGKSSFLDKCLKFIGDVFSCQKTANSFFYQNDFNSLLDIIIREFANSDDINIKLAYLEVLKRAIGTAEFQKGKHRADEIKEIFEELSIVSGTDQRILDKIKEIKATNLI